MEIEDDPSYEMEQKKSTTYLAFLIIVGIFLGLYCLWLVYCFAIGCSNCKTLLWRKRALLIMNFVAVLFSIGVIAGNVFHPYQTDGYSIIN